MVDPIYPTRSFIRFQAKSQLTADLSGQQIMTFIRRNAVDTAMDVTRPNPPQALAPNASDISTTSLEPKQANYQETHHQQANHQDTNVPSSVRLDETLLQEVASLAFHPDQHPEIYQPCKSHQQAIVIEQAIATEIIETYKHIKANATKPHIQALNASLGLSL